LISRHPEVVTIIGRAHREFMSSDRRDHRINLHDEFEVAFWCSRLRCSRDELFIAARLVGSTSGELRRYFQERRRRP